MDKSISQFWVAGINYKKTDASIRSQFAISNDQYYRILLAANDTEVKEFFILSTCNRTEIYGLSNAPDTLINLLCAETAGSSDTFRQLSYVKSNTEAIEHLFNVCAGLDSQVLGDYEILGQVKLAAKFSKQHGFIRAFMERLLNSTIQASKAVKTNTMLSGGTVSVSFAAIQYIKENIPHYSNKHILLLGTGKIGRNTCKNLVDYLGTRHITLINRTTEKAKSLAEELGLQYANINDTAEYISQADIIITSTNAQQPIVFKENFDHTSAKLIIDLSVPYNVHPAVRELPGIKLMDVDELSGLKDETLQKRKAEVPKAKELINIHIGEFIEWVESRKHARVLAALKMKLKEMETCELRKEIPVLATSDELMYEHKIQKVINTTAVKLKTDNRRGCNYIQAINDFIAR